MAFFEQLGEKLNNASNSVSQKTKNFTEVNNLNKAVSANQGNIQNLYLEIGRLYYEAHKDEADADYAQQCAAIRDAFANIANLQAQIREKKGIILCPNCGNEVANGIVYCPSCGIQVRQVAQPVQQPYQNPAAPVQQPYQNQVPPMQQPYQNSVSPEQQQFQNQVPPMQQPYQNPVSPEQQQFQNQVPPVQQPYQEAAPVQSDQTAAKTCAQCGAQIPADSAFCPVCGQRV